MFSPISLEAGVIVIGLFLLLLEAFSAEHKKTNIAWAGIAGLGLVFTLSFFVDPTPGTSPSWNFYTADPLAMFFKRFALVTTIIVLVMSVEYRGVVTKYIFGVSPESGLGEFFALPVFTCAGLMWVASAVDFTLIFVSVELVTISFYVLVAYMRRNNASLEAGVKYLILGALSTGFFVYGITWIFGVTGETNLDKIAAVIPTLHGSETPLLFGFMLVMIALGFKIAAAPFQIWVPDVYQGAPTPVTAYLSVGSKAAGFVVLIRLVDTFLSVPLVRDKVIAAMVVLAALTLIYGNLAALPQTNLKRLLAYSSIAHAGYLLVAVASDASLAVAFYLGGYLLMTLLTFLVMIVVANRTGGDDIAHFAGLHRRSPWLAFAMLVAMGSLAGIPFTVGFFGKFLVFTAAYAQGHFALIAIGLVTVAAGFYYYLKVVRAMYWQESEDTSRIEAAPATNAVIATLIVLIFVLGVYPGPVFDMLRSKPIVQKAPAR